MPRRTIEDLIERERPRNSRDRALKRVTLISPFVVTLLALAAIGIFGGAAALRRVVAYAVLSFFFLGKFLILKGIAGGAFSAFELALLVFYMDLFVAFFLTFNLDYAYRIPHFGARLEGLQEYGEKMLKDRPWLGKITFLGIILFVMFPLSGTGAIGGSLFGRLLGMGRLRTFAGICIGSAAGCFGIAALAEGVAKLLPESVRTSFWFEAVGFTCVLALVLWLAIRSRRIQDRDGDDPPSLESHHP